MRVHPRTREIIVTERGAFSRPARAVDNWAPADAERTVVRAMTAFVGCNASYAVRWLFRGAEPRAPPSGVAPRARSSAPVRPSAACSVGTALGGSLAARLFNRRLVLERDHGRGLSRRDRTRERLSTSTARPAPWARPRCPGSGGTSETAKDGWHGAVGPGRQRNNETHVHPRTPSVKSSVGKAQQTRASAASVWSPAGAERTVKFGEAGIRRVQRELGGPSTWS